MELNQKLKKRLSKNEISEISNTILIGSLNVYEFRDLLVYGDSGVINNVFWVLADLAKLNPNLFDKNLQISILEYCIAFKSNETVLRCGLAIFKKVQIIKDIDDELYDFSFKIAESSSSTIASRSFALVICAKIALKYKELIPELIQLINRIDELYSPASAAIKSSVNQSRKYLIPHLYK